MREEIEFATQGDAVLRGWFIPAPGVEGAAPCVVLQHGFAATKEMDLERYAERFSAAGLSCLIYDHPGFGASEPVPGTPRQEIDPWQQVRGIQDAITYAQSRGDVDADRIGLWGSSFGGAHAYTTAAIDRRVKAVCGQVALISGSRNFATLVRVDFWAQMDAMFAADRAARMAGDPPIVIPVVDADPLATSALPTPDSWAFFSQAPDSFVNEVTLRSMELFRGYEPGSFLPLIAPTPLLMVVAPLDRLAPGEWATAAYETAAHPKELVLLPGGHFDAYTGEAFELGAGAATRFFAEHLGASAPVAGAVT